MARRKKTEEELKVSRARGVAKRYNREQAERAPLFAWAGLTPTITTEAVLERQLAAQTTKFWTGVERAESNASMGFKADWYRYVCWSLVPEDVFAKVAGWADHIKGPVYCRVHAWRTAGERAAAGLDPMPDVATIHPIACSPDLRVALAESADRWREANAAHAAAGCTSERCLVAQRDRPSPFRLNGKTFVNDDGMTLTEWETAA